MAGFSLVFSTTGKGPFQTSKAHFQLQAAGHSQLRHFLKHTVHRVYQKFSIEKINNVNDAPLGSEVEQNKVEFCLKALYLTMPSPHCFKRKLVSLRFRVTHICSFRRLVILNFVIS